MTAGSHCPLVALWNRAALALGLAVPPDEVLLACRFGVGAVFWFSGRTLGLR